MVCVVCAAGSFTAVLLFTSLLSGKRKALCGDHRGLMNDSLLVRRMTFIMMIVLCSTNDTIVHKPDIFRTSSNQGSSKPISCIWMI